MVAPVHVAADVALQILEIVLAECLDDIRDRLLSADDHFRTDRYVIPNQEIGKDARDTTLPCAAISDQDDIHDGSRSRLSIIPKIRRVASLKKAEPSP